MMVPSSLPTFEIPTGLMATGLRGLRGFGRGLGQVSLQPLATAQFSGQLNPSFLPTQYWQPSYLPSGQMSALPGYLYATQAFAQQVAGLLGGSVISAQPPGIWQGTGVPNAYQVQLPDGSVILPGNLFPPGVILDFGSECDVENALLSEIPGSVLSATCAGGGTGLTATQLALQNSNLTPSQQATACSEIDGCVTTPGMPNLTTPVAILSPAIPPVAQPVSVANPTGQAPTLNASSCSTIAASIAQLQSAGLSNVVIWNEILSSAPSMIGCASAVALNPTDAMYQSQSAGIQPGSMSPETQQQTQQQSTGTGTSSNTGTYIAIAAAVLFGAWALSKS
jgi:hypothetical protein